MSDKKRIKVSVIMPAYNASRFIGEAIESVLAQDFDPFELLVADDASTDHTLKIIRKYRDHPKVRIYANNKNRGAAATGNRLVRFAKGQYISVCDADDIMLQGNLKRLSGFLDTHRSFGLVYGDVLMLRVDEQNRLSETPRVVRQDHRKAWDLIENTINHPGSMIRKSLMLRVGGYDETLYSIYDWSLWLKLAEVTKFKYLENEIYYLWRRNPGSLTQTDKRSGADLFKIVHQAAQRRYGISSTHQIAVK